MVHSGRERRVCELCGRSSLGDAESCMHCGTRHTIDSAVGGAPNADLPHGREQTVMLIAETSTFLADGRLGQIYTGCSKDDVRRIAGIPADFGRGDSLDDAEIWLNGALTFWFAGSTLERIGVYFTIEYPQNQTIDFDSEFPRRGDSVDKVIDFMVSHGIAFEELNGCLLTAGNVEIRWSKRDRTLTSLVTPPVPFPPKAS